MINARAWLERFPYTVCKMFTGALHLELEIEEKDTFELQTRSSQNKYFGMQV